MSAATASGLGPQCLSCRKRQVKCDSTPNSCKRCQKDNIVCPGYKKQLKWAHFVAPRRPGAKLQRVRTEAPKDQDNELILRHPRHDEESALVLESVDYYNTFVVPYVSPAHRPFRRNFVPTHFWPYVPTILKHIWIVINKTTQSGKALCDPILNADLCYYRGRSLTCLQNMLSDTETATNDPHALALMSVLFVMGADMQLCEEHWTTHLEAARRIIVWRGGFVKCLQNSVGNEGPLINYLHADIMTATTCNAWLLNSRAVQSQFEYLSIIPTMESRLIANGHPCPKEIFRAIVYTNILRVTLRRPLTKEERQLIQSHPYDFETVRNTIQSFDSDLWAVHISHLDRALPQKATEELEDLSIACLVSLGECFKSAAMLYLCLSTKSVDEHSKTLLSAKENLSHHLGKLFDNASVDTDGPLHSRLWVFTAWPIFISAYVKAGWDIGEEDMDADLDRLNALTATFSAGRLSDGEKLLRRIRQQRVPRYSTDLWSWDDGFSMRCAYAV